MTAVYRPTLANVMTGYTYTQRKIGVRSSRRKPQVLFISLHAVSQLEHTASPATLQLCNEA